MCANVCSQRSIVGAGFAEVNVKHLEVVLELVLLYPVEHVHLSG